MCERTGLTERQVRFYEQKGLIEGIQRTPGGQRTYQLDQVRRLELIRQMREARIGLADIKLTLRVLSRSSLGVEGEGLHRVREVLGTIRAQLTVADELLGALEARAARHDRTPIATPSARGDSNQGS